jgi:hypothetical protein
MRFAFWTVVRAFGSSVLNLGDALYWAGKRGQRRNSKRNKLL